jgi:hypothetical protein
MYQFVVLMVKHMTMIVNDRRRKFLLVILTIVSDAGKSQLNVIILRNEF